MSAEHDEAHLLQRARLRHVIGQRVADGEVEGRDHHRGEDGEDEGAHVGGVEGPIHRLEEEGLVLLERQVIVRAAALHGRQLRVEAFDHHVEIGQHHEEQRPEGHQHDEGDAQHRAVALEEGLVGGIVRELLLRPRHHPEDGDHHEGDEENEKAATHGPSSLPAAPRPSRARSGSSPFPHARGCGCRRAGRR